MAPPLQASRHHHGIGANPFADEDAQTDRVFKGYCITNTYHPTWDKVYGNPGEPATAIVFGEKGSGKTASPEQAEAVKNGYWGDISTFNNWEACLRSFLVGRSSLTLAASRLIDMWTAA